MPSPARAAQPGCALSTVHYTTMTRYELQSTETRGTTSRVPVHCQKTCYLWRVVRALKANVAGRIPEDGLSAVRSTRSCPVMIGLTLPNCRASRSTEVRRQTISVQGQPQCTTEQYWHRSGGLRSAGRLGRRPQAHGSGACFVVASVARTRAPRELREAASYLVVTVPGVLWLVGRSTSASSIAAEALSASDGQRKLGESRLP